MLEESGQPSFRRFQFNPSCPSHFWEWKDVEFFFFALGEPGIYEPHLGRVSGFCFLKRTGCCKVCTCIVGSVISNHPVLKFQPHPFDGWQTNKMELVGVVRCPLHHLCMYGDRRQLNPKDVNRIAKRFLRVKCAPSKEANHLRGIITHHDLEAILSSLRKSRKELTATIRNGPYPLLSNFRIACLDGRQRLAAASRHHSRKWWVVKLFCVAGDWVEFPVKLVSDNVDERGLQDEVESYSHESSYSDGEIYRLVRKYMKAKDESRETECRTRLSSCREISLNGLLKQPDIRDSLDGLLEFPGIVGGLQLGNFHKHVALHCNEQIKHYFDERIRHTWTLITDDDPQLKRHVDMRSVEWLQLRVPAACKTDQREIRRMLDNREVFEEVTDSGMREQLKLKVLSLNVLIPSVETFHENMKFFSIGAKILCKYIMDDPPKGRTRATLFQNLSAKWTRPAVSYMETSDDCLMPLLEPELTSYIAYKIVMLAALRNFPNLSTDSPRQDVRGETMPSKPLSSHIRYLQMLACVMGFKTQKVMLGVSKRMELHDIPTFIPQPGPLADWRGGKPFTKTFLSLRSLAYLVNMSSEKKFMEENLPNALFVMRDFMNAFFENSETYVVDDRGPGTRLERAVASECETLALVSSQINDHCPRQLSTLPEDASRASEPEASSTLKSPVVGIRGHSLNKPSSPLCSDTFAHTETRPPVQATKFPSVERSTGNEVGSRVRFPQDNSTMLHDTSRSLPNSEASSPEFQVNRAELPHEMGGPTDAVNASGNITLRSSLCSVVQNQQSGLQSTIDGSRYNIPAGTITEDTLRRSSARSPLGISSIASTQSNATTSCYLANDLPGSNSTCRRENVIINGELWNTYTGSLNTETTDRDQNRANRDALLDNQVDRQTSSTNIARPEQTRLVENQHLSTNSEVRHTISEDTIVRTSTRSPPRSFNPEHVGPSPRATARLRRSTREQAAMPSRMGRLPSSGDYRFTFECPPDTVMGAYPAGHEQRSTISPAVRIRPIRSMRTTPQPIRVPPIRSMRVTKRTDERVERDSHSEGMRSQVKKQARLEDGRKQDRTTETSMLAEQSVRPGLLVKKRSPPS